MKPTSWELNCEVLSYAKIPQQKNSRPEDRDRKRISQQRRRCVPYSKGKSAGRTHHVHRMQSRRTDQNKRKDAKVQRRRELFLAPLRLRASALNPRALRAAASRGANQLLKRRGVSWPR